MRTAAARSATILTLISLTGLGCAERRIHVTSDPPGAIVTLNDVEVGRTPVSVDFTWFGEYDVRLRKEGYQTLLTSAEAEPELHDQPVLDIVAALIPGPEHTDVRWHFVLEPMRTDADELIERARETRELAPRPADEGDDESVEEAGDDPTEQPGETIEPAGEERSEG